MKRYEAYKPSNLPWVVRIPSGWKISKNSQLFRESSELSERGEEPLLSLSQYTGISYKSNAVKVGMREADSKVGYRVIHKDDIVMNIMLAWNGSTAVSPFDGIISPAYAVYRQRTALNPKYFHYLFRIPAICSYFESNSTGLIKSRLRLYSDSFMRLFSIVPPREEQDQIVRYLDWQVSKINRLIAAKRKQIALLKEQKQRRITEVVTHGLNPNVPHKDSGIAWIRAIPAHWHCVALKRCATVKSGITLGKQYPVGTKLVSVPYLRVANVQDGFVNTETVTNLNVTPEEATQYALPKGCVLMTEGGDRDKLGRGCVWNGEIENCIHQNHIFAVTVNDKLLLNKWLEYVSACDIGRVYFDITAIKTTNLACTNASKVMAFPIPLPPHDEQECIVNELNRITSRYNDARKSLEKQIECLQELRTRLISDVVTGQVDVRGIKVPEFEMFEDVVSTDKDDKDVEERKDVE